MPAKSSSPSPPNPPPSRNPGNRAEIKEERHEALRCQRYPAPPRAVCANGGERITGSEAYRQTVGTYAGKDAMGSLITWAWLGAALRHWLSVGSRMRIFNLAMGVLLAATALWLTVL